MKFLLIFFSTLLPASLSAQWIVFDTDHEHILSLMDWDALGTMKLEYRPPEGFIGRFDTECFESMPKFKKAHNCFVSHIESKDSNLVVFYYFPSVFTRKDSIRYKKIFPDFQHYGVDLAHFHIIDLDLQASLQKDKEWVKRNRKKYVTYHSQAYAKQAFNADTVISYPINLYGKKLWDRYDRLKAIMLQKNGGGYAVLYCFYNDRGEKNWDTYMKSIEKMLRYKEEEEEVKVIFIDL